MDLQEIYDRQNRRVYRLAMLYLKNSHDAEDAVQNVFMKWMNRPVSFDSEEHENAWFYSVTKNYCKDCLKSFWKRKVSFCEIPETIEESSQSEELIEQIWKLPAKYREVLYLYYYEEYSVKEMSSLLHRKESTLQTQLATAREKLRTILGKEEE